MKNPAPMLPFLESDEVNNSFVFDYVADMPSKNQIGEYRAVYEKIYACESTVNHSIRFNFQFSKKSSSITELKGNATYLIPFDDTLTLDTNLASWSLTGGWKPNSAVYITKSACTNTKKILGNTWNSMVKAFDIASTGCPIPVGTYIAPGINLKELEDHNFPKVYFYGKYKLQFKMKNQEKKVIGCTVVELSLIRPWEKPI
ncbi:uncharacterized protein LOC107884636 [Acyrthosiphon pisum]|uniref:MD-2-related lipid-recognition domain-containing protein n=1 Tax=Acyrthosiphon pisum TaxID=7029 RepID=A0A8R2D780_ACYPI|nr:uncharacterized protein LOC107884636 [Acyrthosiphon pisum]|eukprot:XP_016662669.1 PREDICTED: uncharacterized protein LOC107884636 [Acyrthosiphon pisum]